MFLDNAAILPMFTAVVLCMRLGILSYGRPPNKKCSKGERDLVKGSNEASALINLCRNLAILERQDTSIQGATFAVVPIPQVSN